jgi:tRNA(Leu) C34 or U34 (ribose-2'-O)-methylase TrmL
MMNNNIRIAVWGKGAPPHGVCPSIALVNPKYPHNVGMAVRLASCYGLKQVWFSGDRLSLNPAEGDRLPREERMKDYNKVQLIQHDYFFEQFPQETTPVAVEVRDAAEPLHSFEHPDKALYVFGAEDGTIPKVLLQHCHRFIVIPTKHCLNLATAVATILWDREYKLWLAGKIDKPVSPGEHEARGFEEAPSDWVISREYL